MKRILHKKLTVFLLLVSCCAIAGFVRPKPVLYLIGDSTVATGSKKGDIQGWGGLLHEFLDTARIDIRNRAISGTSSRTYYTKGVHDKSIAANGMWEGVLSTLKKGDFVLIQFGHNDESPVQDSTRSRGSIKGTGDDTLQMFNKFLNRTETVHSYGWYMQQFIVAAQNKGAIPIVCSAIPKNKWKGERIVRNDMDYGKWAAEVAERNHALFIDLNELAADTCDAAGKEKTAAQYFVADNVHTSMGGARINARLVTMATKELKHCALKKYLIKK